MLYEDTIKLFLKREQLSVVEHERILVQEEKAPDYLVTSLKGDVLGYLRQFEGTTRGVEYLTTHETKSKDNIV